MSELNPADTALIEQFSAGEAITVSGGRQLTSVEDTLTFNLLPPPNTMKPVTAEKYMMNWAQRPSLISAVRPDGFHGDITDITVVVVQDLETELDLAPGRFNIPKNVTDLQECFLGFCVLGTLSSSGRSERGTIGRTVLIRRLSQKNAESSGKMWSRSLGIDRGENLVAETIQESSERAKGIALAPGSFVGRVRPTRTLDDGVDY